MNSLHTIFYNCGCHKALTCSATKARKAAMEAETEICSDCLAKTRARHEAATAQAAIANADLPAMIGSQKQIDWAETIRAKQAVQLREYLALIAKAAETAVNAAMHEHITNLLHRPDAKAWIETRNVNYIRP